MEYDNVDGSTFVDDTMDGISFEFDSAGLLLLPTDGSISDLDLSTLGSELVVRSQFFQFPPPLMHLKLKHNFHFGPERFSCRLIGSHWCE
jgi:hypothetical protein